MGRIVAIDYGTKRVGLAVTDPLQIIATGLTTVHSSELLDYLDDYCSREQVECIVIGEPRRMNNEPSAVEAQIAPLVTHLGRRFPNVKIDRADERFTSKLAVQSMLDAGLKKKDRQRKELVDKASATILLQSYLEQKTR